MREFVVARNPEDASSLPYLVRLPLPDSAVVLKVRDVWPRTAKVYCHRAVEWPEDPDIVERVPVRDCRRRGAAVDLVLDRARENRSQFVFTKARARDVIFWRSARTTRQARPNVAVPTARAAGRQLEILVDVHERSPWTFGHQQATTRRANLAAGDYVVVEGEQVVAAVERKSLVDLVSTMTAGKLRYLLAELAILPAAAVVVEDRYSAVFKVDRVRPTTIAEGARRGGGALPVRADRVRRDPTAGSGVDVPAPQCRPRPPRRRRCSHGAGDGAPDGWACRRRSRRRRRSAHGLANKACRSPIGDGCTRTSGTHTEDATPSLRRPAAGD